jgi:TonB family protein
MALNRIGNYELLGELGRGGMGVVYRGVDSFIKRPVAIKTIYLSEIGDDQERQFLRDRLYREAQSAGILSHPNIVTIYQIGEQDEITYIAMEFVEGKDLSHVLRRRDEAGLDDEFIVSVIEQTAAGLDHAHSKGVVHRDIKPANIIIRHDGVAKITDFGIAKISSQTVTRTGMTLGTPHFMAPEQIQGKPLDGRADQYSLGVVMYEAVTGKRPFTAETMTTLIFKIVTDQVEPRRDNPAVSEAVSAVLKRALAKNPDDRYPNCAALAHAFRQAMLPALESSTAGSTTGTQSWPPPPAALFPTGTAPLSTSRPSTPATPSGGIAPPPKTGHRTATPTGYPQSSGAIPQYALDAGRSSTPTSTPTPSPNALTPQAPPMTPTGFSAGTPVPAGVQPARSNAWLIPVLVIAGLAFVAALFGIVNLVNWSIRPQEPQVAALSGELATGSRDEATATGGESQGGSNYAERGEAVPDNPGSLEDAVAAGPSAASIQPVSSRKPATPKLTASRATPQPTSRPAAASAGSRGNVVPASSAAPTSSNIASTKPPASSSQPSTPTPTEAASRATPVKLTVTDPTPGSSSPVENASAATSQGAAPVPPVAESAAAKPSAPQVLTRPRPTLRVPAVYPPAARKDGVSGTVALRATVTPNGLPTQIEVVRGIRPDLNEAARAALGKWRFQPGTADGRPVASQVNVEISFSLVQEKRKPISLKNP